MAQRFVSNLKMGFQDKNVLQSELLFHFEHKHTRLSTPKNTSTHTFRFVLCARFIDAQYSATHILRTQTNI